MPGWIETANRATTLMGRIRALLSMADAISFDELERLDGFRGGMALLADENLVLWPAVSARAVADLQALIARGECHVATTSLFTYITGSCFPALPIAKRRAAYRRPHWLPAVLRRGKAETKTRRSGGRARR